MLKRCLMLEPICSDPALLWQHHKEQAAKQRAAGDPDAAYWHGRQAQRARKSMLEQEHQSSLQRGRLAASQTTLEAMG